jgi:hypothetical protein
MEGHILGHFNWVLAVKVDQEGCALVDHEGRPLKPLQHSFTPVAPNFSQPS